ncbi:sugar ABC transporter permease [Paenibacillus sambharensis]|uniref:Sugar ABC transporter permease n=1 Tax=Paenibacillus sambharensis TaxID=1803190 RepID=A0A2W1M188_9BACL|nr:ABC transporter permease subunit [Paenibacillus sambharensis]PZD97427.1 sugar ABC transporter permease [Paenibacillus sambharensis]
MKGTFRQFYRNIPLHLMIIPGIIIVLIYSYIPMAGLIIAFQDFSPIAGFRNMTWNGLDNFRYLFELPGFYQVVWNTVFISVMKITAGLTVPVIVALLLNEVRTILFKRTVQTIIYMPHFFSWVILGGIIVDVLSPGGGIVNLFLKWIGVQPIQFLASNDWFPYILVITDQWKEFGFGTIIYLAALTSIDRSLYEAAVIDGASRWKQTWHITLPGIRPIMILMLTLSLGNVLNGGFDQVFNLYNPLVYESGDILDTMIYRIGLQDAQYSVSTALGLIKSIVSLILIGVGYFLAYRVANYRIF